MSFEPFNTGATSHSPDGEGTFAFDSDATLCLPHVSTQVWDAGAFDLRGELVYHRCHGGIGYTILGEWESQETTGNLTGGVDKYASAHRTLDVFMPPSTRPMRPREEVFDHAQCAEGVAAIWVGYSHGVCSNKGGFVSRDGYVSQVRDLHDLQASVKVKRRIG